MRTRPSLFNADRSGNWRACVFNRSGFSLLELLVVLAIIVIIAVLYTEGGRPSKPARNFQACQQNLEKIYLAMEIYARDYRGKYPVVTNALTSETALALLSPRYASDTSVFICPADTTLPKQNEPFGEGRVSYAYYMGRSPGEERLPLMSDQQVNARSKDAGDRVFSPTGNPPGNNHRAAGGNVLFIDGHVERFLPSVPIPLLLPENIVLLNPKP